MEDWMSTKDNGGPAFPVTLFEGQTLGDGTANGMTLRDYGAFKALQGFCANPAVFAANGISGWGLVNCTEEQLSNYAYFLADAMLKARQS
jgi:hypothetical protein